MSVLLLVPAMAECKTGALEVAIEGHTVVIYSSMEKAGGCKASVLFSYEKEGQRRTRKLECNFRVPAKAHYRFCEASDPEFIDIKIESAITGGCE
ncbi:MAG: hypothetical protein C5B46_05780 [Proteobacteria bacterium]|nr:MAG: hypothetical protein C5B46_05780 [Pseudomonadota bacterium]